MKHYELNLYSYLRPCWREIIEMLLRITVGLESIHEKNLIHGNLHGGNILLEVVDEELIDTKIADTGLHGPFDNSQQVYGVIPFITPEILNGDPLTKESDIYSFGMIMWMLSSGTRPHSDKKHDSQLIKEIMLGLRPSVVFGTPTVFADLMRKCLDSEPSNRPTVF